MARSIAFRIASLAASLLAWQAVPADFDGDWIGLDTAPPVLLGAEAGRNTGGDAVLSFSIDAPLAPTAAFIGNYATTAISDGEQNFDSHAFASVLWIEVGELLDVELGHFFDGNSGELEREALGLSVGFDFGEWRLAFEFSDGETRIYTRDFGFDPIDDRVPAFIETAVDGEGITLGNRGPAWYWQLNHRRFEYDRDLGALADSRLVRQLVSTSALAHSGLLVSRQSSLLLGHADLDDDVSLLFARDKSAIDDSEAEVLAISWLRWSDADLGYRLSASTPLPDADELGLTLGLRWLL